MDNFFEEGEKQLGRYTVVLLNQSKSGRWMPSVMQLDAIVTNYRMLLRPHRKKYRPAWLPAKFIVSTELTRRGNWHCIAMKVRTNHVLYISLSTGKLDDLHDDLHAMRVPPPKYAFDDSVAKQDIERLITFFGRKPLTDTSQTEPEQETPS
ncbi:MAG: hypothetical protein AAFN11_03275 [Chloroflexota bacterium]